MNDYNPNAIAGLQAMLMPFIWFFLAFGIFMIICQWKVYSKAGKPGWASIVPIYNYLIMLDIAGKPRWWFLLMLIPFVNIIIAIIVLNEVCKNFGKGVGFTIGMIFLPFIFYPILAFGSAQYTPPGPPAGGAGVAVA